MEWSESGARCANVAAGAAVHVLTAAAGAVSAPQAKVTYVRLAPVATTWAFPAVPEDTPVAFPVSVDVRFVAQPQSAADVVRGLPPLSTFPEDLFYPFTV